MTLPTQIGRYAIEKLLARTDLSEVYVAVAPDGNRVCLKRLLPSLADGAQTALSFRREATLLAEVSHPNVVRVLEVGEDGGIPFTCLELLEGEPLSGLAAKGLLPVADAVELLKQVARGLERVHDRGLVHADLKPSNVLLQLSGSDRVAKLADFGLAGDSGASNVISGTPHYMSPEQTRLVDWPMDARSDLYSFGVMAFELLCGRLPFDAKDPAALLKAQVAEKPPRPSQLRPEIPPILERIVLRLLEKNPAARYRNARSVVADLEELQARLSRGEATPEFGLDSTADVSERVGQVFVGRHAELSELEASLGRARQGRPGAVFVGGVAGVGKSALLREFQNRSLTGGARFAAGKCYEFARGLPYYVLAEALTDHLRRLKQAPRVERELTLQRLRAAAGELGGELVKLAPAYAEVFPDAKPSVYLGEGRDRARFLEMLGRVLAAAAPAGAPLVLLLDDLQWSDSGTIEALDNLIETASSCSLLLLATYRSEEVSADHPFHKLLAKAEAGQKQSLADLRLKPFDKAQTKLMIAESLRQPSAAVPDVILDRVHEKTEGNPLFVSEVLKALVGSGAIEISSGLLQVSLEKLEATHLPGSVVDIVLRRMDALDEKTRRVIGAAALIGKGFTLQLLSHAAACSNEEAFAAIGLGVEHKLLQPPRDGVYRFHHDRVQEASRKLIPDAVRPAFHRRVVEWLEQSGADKTEDGVFDLAEHSSQAQDHDRAWRWCREAAEKAAARYANDQALSYFRRALTHAEAGAADVAAQRPVRARMTQVLDLLGRYQDSIAEYGRILEGDLSAEERARLMAGLAYSMQKAGDYKESKNRLTEALSILGVRIEARFGALSTFGARIAFLAASVWSRLFGGRVDERSKLVVEILTRLFNIYSIVEAKKLPYLVYRLMRAAVRLGPSYELAVAHGKMAIGLPQLPRPPLKQAVRHGQQSVEVARKLGHHLIAGQGLMYTSAVLVWSARYKEALSTLKGAREALAALGEMWDLANAHIFSYLANRACGRYDDAMAHAQALVELGERTRAFGTIANGHQKIAEVLLLRGDVARGESHLEKSIAIADERKLNFDRFQAYKIRGGARLREGKWAEARTQFQAAIKLNETPGISFFRAYISDTYLAYVEAVLKDGDYLAELGGLRGATTEAGYLKKCLRVERMLHGHLGYAYKVQGLWQWRAGAFGRSRRSFLKALSLLRAQERPVDAAIVLLDAADALGERYREEALTWVKQARPVFEEQRLVSYVAACDRVLARLGEAVAVAAKPADDRSTHALKELISVSQLLMESRDPDVLLERIVDASVSLLGAERGFIFTRDNDGSELVLRVGRTAEGSGVPAQDAKVSRGVIDRVDQSGEGLAVSDTEQDESLRERRSVMAFQLRSVLCAPLTHAGKKLGVLYLDSQITQAIFGPRELELLQSFAAQAAIALANALQFQTIEEMNRNLDAKVLERTRELEAANVQISASMKELRDTTLRLAEARREALEKELEVARQIQLSMVPPRGVADLAAARLTGLLEPASLCGGDFWLYVEAGDKLLFFIGDVTGHGVGSAMITATARSCVDTLFLEQGGKVPLEKLMATLNDVIFRASNGELVMTAFAAEVEKATGTMSYSVAGHNPQYLLRTNGPAALAPVTGLMAPGMRLGDGPGNTFTVQKVQYQPGDRLVLYTDGVVELENAKAEQYGDRRFRRLVQQNARLPVEDLLQKVDTDLKTFADGTPPPDDVTLVVAELR